MGTLPTVELSADEAPIKHVAARSRDDVLVRLWIRETNKFQRLTEQEEIAVAQRIEQGDQCARIRFIEANLYLVVAIARKFSSPGLSFLDLVQEGNIGLMKAIDRFDWREGVRFSVTAAWLIRGPILKAVAEQGSTICLPDYAFWNLRKILATRSTLREQLDREPTAADMAAALGMVPETVESLLAVAGATVSLEEPIGDDERAASIEDVIADRSRSSPAQTLQESDRDEEIRSLLATLTEREARVIKMRFGLEADDREYTLREIGRRFQPAIGSEAVRQIERKAIGKLRRRLQTFRPLESRGRRFRRPWRQSWRLQPTQCGDRCR